MAIELQKLSYYSFVDFYIYYEFQKYTLVLKLIKELFGGFIFVEGLFPVRAHYRKEFTINIER